MIIFGIDPSLTGTAIYTCVDGNYNHELFNTKSSQDDVDRMLEIVKRIMTFINTYGGYNVKVGIEGFSMMSRGRGKGQLFGLGWLIRAKLKENKIPYIEIPPTMVKKFATGKGNCEKSLILKEVYRKYGFDTNNDNIADAFVIHKIAKYYFDKINPKLSYENEVITKLRASND